MRLPSRLVAVAWLVGLAAALPQPVSAAAPLVHVAHVDGVINAVSASYVSGSVARAGSAGAGALIVLLNTPGGISTAMDDIMTSLLNAPIPVAVYVAPSGARAASAGLFVSQAADVVAMAPGTNIGSAHPVTGSGGDLTGELGRKVLNDAVARIRSLATLHGRNADWCEQAVRDSANVDAAEAVRIGVADLQVSGLPQLLESLDGREARRPSSRVLTFHTRDARLEDVPVPWLQQLLHTFIDPNVAYLLLLVAIFCLLTELTSPGAILPGVVGGITALLALTAFSTLPVNIAGILLVGLAFLLFVIDVKAPTHGVLTVGGLAALLLGSGLLIDTGPVGMGIDWRLILLATLAITGGCVLVLRKAIGARSRTDAIGAALVGSIGEARGALSPSGQVFVAGAMWPAISTSGPIAPGQTIRVVAQERRELRVEAFGRREPAPTPHGDV